MFMTAIFLVFMWLWHFTELLFYLLALTWWTWPLTSLSLFSWFALKVWLLLLFFFPITRPPAQIKDVLHETRCAIPVFPSFYPKRHDATCRLIKYISSFIAKLLRVCNQWHEGDHVTCERGYSFLWVNNCLLCLLWCPAKTWRNKKRNANIKTNCRKHHESLRYCEQQK